MFVCVILWRVLYMVHHITCMFVRYKPLRTHSLWNLLVCLRGMKADQLDLDKVQELLPSPVYVNNIWIISLFIDTCLHLFVHPRLSLYLPLSLTLTKIIPSLTSTTLPTNPCMLRSTTLQTCFSSLKKLE